MIIVLEIVVSILLLIGAGAVLTAARVLFVEKDAISRINSFGIATSLGLPFITAGAMVGRFLNEGFSWEILLKSLAAILAFILVSSVASNTLVRAAYLSGAPIDPATEPNDLADPAPNSATD